jgi:hypothetical protein
MSPAEFRTLAKRIGPRTLIATALKVHPVTVQKWANGDITITPERAAQIRALAADPPTAEMVGAQVLGPAERITVSPAIDGSSNSVSIKRVGGKLEQTVVVPPGSRLRVGDIEVFLPAVVKP